MQRIEWCPGNGTRYDIFYAVDESGRVYFTWLFSGRSGGTTLSFDPGIYIHYSYLMEKMNLKREGDAAGLLAFLHSRGYNVGMPTWCTVASPAWWRNLSRLEKGIREEEEKQSLPYHHRNLNLGEL